MEEDQNQVVGKPYRALRDYVAPILIGPMLSILRPTIASNNFEIKLTLITMIQTSIQFGRHPNDDTHAYINNFLNICDTLKINKVGDNAIQLRLFPFSLLENAKSWLTSLPPSSIITQDDLAKKFLAKVVANSNI